ncbi:MAG: M14 family metallopeptidase, partial [Gammaproteobacteria bacterium]|nr:M14 family metallopeptidase [Gammaproteobacteria bacterium]
MTDRSIDTYLNYDDLSKRLLQLAAEQPHIMQVKSIGKSFAQRDIWLVSLTQFSSGPANDKPALWIDANIHSSELVSSMAALNFIQWMLDNKNDADVQRCLETRTLYICPRVNPDGAEWALAPVPKLVRSGIRAYPYEEPLTDGIEVQDIDGDGRMLSMRIKDSNGAWKISEHDSRLMVRRNAIETGGSYYRLLPEGLIRNFDGFHIPPARKEQNLDFNRNFPVQWRNEQEQKGAGHYPVSEPEVRAVVDFISQHTNICAALSLHSYSGVLLRPYSFKADDQMPAEDLWLFQKIGQQGEQLTGYPAVSAYHDFRYHPQEVITGAMDDWIYEDSGRIAWTVELWSPHRQAGIKMNNFIDWYREHPFEDDLKLMQWNDTSLQGNGFVNWYSYSHPQLGEVELGGWDSLFNIWNPPPSQLQNEVDRLPKWLLWHTLITPRLEWLHCKSRKIDLGIFQLDVAVINSGWLPTQISQHALKNKLVRGVVFEIESDVNITFLQGQPRMETEQLHGRHDTPSSPNNWLGQNGDATNDRIRMQWLIQIEQGASVSITARHERAGTLH